MTNLRHVLRTNSGFLVEKRETDYIFGLATRIEHEDRNTTGNWEIFLPADEHQKGRFFDTMGCVTFSAMNSIECQLRWMLANNLLPKPTLDFLNAYGYIADNGFPNLSDRFTVRMSGTTPNGNSMQNVWDSIRRDGIVPEALWPNNLEQFNRDQYFTDPQESVKAVGKEFLKHFKAEYEWVNDKAKIPKALRHAPLHIATATCSGWFDEPVIQTCQQQANHATMLYAITKEGNYADYDSYPEYRKVLAKDYAMPFIIKGVLTPILDDAGNVKPSTKFHYDRDLVYGEKSIDVSHLQNRLAVIDPPTGWYGPMTVKAVKQFMNWHQIGTWFERNVWPAGRRVGPKTRAVLNR